MSTILIPGKFTSARAEVNTTVAANAVNIANMVLASDEFEQALLPLDFSSRNIGQRHGPRIPGSSVVAKARSKQDFAIDLYMRDCRNEFGHATAGIPEIYSCYKVLRNDDDELPFEYIYAYHICHEYMHILGYYHTDHKDDVAEKVGWVAYHIVKKWFKDGKDFQG